ncbi:MAG: DUF1731 domain-containing protein [Deltaproteobacteria bacterium]|nr:DUF1731 domain-containing protein [Deltaproteobacteria bacterium]
MRAVAGFALGAVFGERSAILTASQRALPRVATRGGYVFRHASLAGALAADLGRATSFPADSSS